MRPGAAVVFLAMMMWSSATAERNPTEIRPFKVAIPSAKVEDLRRRIAATNWPERETVTDPTQGVQLATMQKLADYWGKSYDWRKAEAKLNAYPQFITNIDGLDIHFIHVRSKQPHALPVIITHGWPGSIIEQLKIIEPLTNPTAHGGTAADAFDVVIPSLPGHGFSGKPTATGWDPQHIARAWTVLMKRLGATVPDDVAKALQFGQPPPAGLSSDEKRAWRSLPLVCIGKASCRSLRRRT